MTRIRGSRGDVIEDRVVASRTAAALLEEFLLRLLNIVAGSVACNLLTSIYNGESRGLLYCAASHHIKGHPLHFCNKKS